MGYVDITLLAQYEKMIFKTYTQVVFSCWIIFVNLCYAQDVLVEIDQGSLNGTIKYDRKGGAFYSFQTIPYAKPPVGELRFKDPQPPESWLGILDASEDLPECYQEDSYTGKAHGTEDCLYLNVYTPQLPLERNESLKSVMVFIHGGGFMDGSARQELFSPEHLIPENIVLVTVNYRLGILGFFSLNDEKSGTPGNAGLKDQVMALKWVQNNIAKFGGDSNSVTVFGESAGGWSTHLLVLSPLAADLFHRAIIESVTGINPSARYEANNGEYLAQALDIPTDDKPAMLSSLRELTPERLWSAQRKARELYGSSIEPIVESQTDGTAFLTAKPLTLIKTGQYNHVPVMIGYNDAEGIAIDQDNLLRFGYSKVTTDFFSMIPGDLDIVNGTQEAEELSAAIKYFYYNETEPSTDDMKPFIQMITDIHFGHPAYRTAVEHVKTAQEHIFFYRFSADTLVNVYKRRENTTATYEGASHGDELGYLFSTHMTPEIEAGSVEDLAIDRVVKLWVNFAKYKTPTPNDFEEFQWPNLTEETFYYVDIGTNSSVPGVDPDPDNMKFWSDVYKKYYSM